MLEPTSTTNDEIKELLKQNQALLIENNKLLHKIRRSALWAMVFRLVWLVAFLGFPVALYYYVIKPNLAGLEETLSTFEEGAKGLSDVQDIFKNIPQPR